MKKERCFFLSILELTPPSLAYSRHSDSGERVKSYAASAKGKRGEKTREDSFYFSLVNCFARALLSERLEKATNVLIECGVYSRELFIGSFTPICRTYLRAVYNQVNLVLSFF